MFRGMASTGRSSHGIGRSQRPRAACGCWDKQECLSLRLLVSGRQAGTETLCRFFVYNSSAESLL